MATTGEANTTQQLTHIVEDGEGHIHELPHPYKKKPSAKPSALSHQEGGEHYKLPIQPLEFIHANSIPFTEGNIIKYVTRWRTKNGLQDLRKAQHYLEMLIELEELA